MVGYHLQLLNLSLSFSLSIDMYSDFIGRDPNYKLFYIHCVGLFARTCSSYECKVWLNLIFHFYCLLFQFCHVRNMNIVPFENCSSTRTNSIINCRRFTYTYLVGITHLIKHVIRVWTSSKRNHQILRRNIYSKQHFDDDLTLRLHKHTFISRVKKIDTLWYDSTENIQRSAQFILHIIIQKCDWNEHFSTVMFIQCIFWELFLFIVLCASEQKLHNKSFTEQTSKIEQAIVSSLLIFMLQITTLGRKRKRQREKEEEWGSRQAEGMHTNMIFEISKLFFIYCYFHRPHSPHQKKTLGNPRILMCGMYEYVCAYWRSET